MTTHDIAVDFLEKANPSHLESDVDYGWYPMCELRDRETEELMDLTSGSSIVSADLLDDLIRSLLY